MKKNTTKVVNNIKLNGTELTAAVPYFSSIITKFIYYCNLKVYTEYSACNT